MPAVISCHSEFLNRRRLEKCREDAHARDLVAVSILVATTLSHDDDDR